MVGLTSKFGDKIVQWSAIDLQGFMVDMHKLVQLPPVSEICIDVDSQGINPMRVQSVIRQAVFHDDGELLAFTDSGEFEGNCIVKATLSNNIIMRPGKVSGTIMVIAPPLHSAGHLENIGLYALSAVMCDISPIYERVKE